MMSQPPTGPLRWRGLAVHLLTASGAGWAWLALVAAIDHRFGVCFGWLSLALLVDGLDGALARAWAVGETAARYDGAVLDLVVDFVTYAVVPLVVLWRSDLLPSPLSSIAIVVILVATALYFADTQMKTDDHWFRGFPGCWNAVVFGVLAFRPLVGVTLGLLGLCTILMFVPLRFVHPFRVRGWLGPSIVAGAIGAAAAGVLMIEDFAPSIWPRVGLAVAALYFAGVGFIPRRIAA